METLSWRDVTGESRSGYIHMAGGRVTATVA